ncbi:MAG TPA: hypothetical protein VH062_35670 [Polyangiaceae bacterium]|jgi:hypothetical protein|nr:hypothetical protein [Polyangiaceae bacterium]
MPTKLQDLFDQVMPGPRIELTGYAAGYAKMSRLVVQNNSFPIHLEFVGRGETNACSRVETDAGLIAVNVGTFWVIHDTFRRMLAHHGVLKAIGDPTKETEFPTELPPRNAVDIAQRDISQWFVPVNDPVRSDYAEELTAMALEFVSVHEAAHILNGHCGFYQDHLNGATLDESVVATPSGISQAFRHAIEIDADSCAVTEGMKRIRIDSLNPLFPTLEDTLFAWAFAIGVLFHIWSPYWPHVAMASPTHPPPSTRWLFAYVTGMSGVDEWLGAGTQATWLRASAAALRECLRAYSLISGNPEHSELFKDALDNGRQRMHAFHDDWRDLHPLLLPHAKIPLVAPQPVRRN